MNNNLTTAGKRPSRIAPSQFRRCVAALVLALPGIALAQDAVATAAQSAREDGPAKAATVMAEWPAGKVSTQKSPGKWAYEEGVLLDGMAAEYEVTGNPATLAYIRATVDGWVAPDGSITESPGKPFDQSGHTLDNLEPARAVLFCYRATGQARYAKAAKMLNAQFDTQPRNSLGGFWHKDIYPHQMWLDGAYMGEPFRAGYASIFKDPAEFSDIAKQILLMDEHMRDPRTGLLRHGWDESKEQAWADKTTGLSQESWARAMGWYAAAIADTLPWFPADHPDRPKLIAAYNRLAESVARYQDPASGLWWDVMDKGGREGNFLEASASAMFTYALAKGVRLGFLPAKYTVTAAAGWNGIEHKFITREGDHVVLHGTVKVSGLGGKPYRSGTYDYYIHEPVGDDDAKGVGAYLLAASEIARLDGAKVTGPGDRLPFDAKPH